METKTQSKENKATLFDDPLEKVLGDLKVYPTKGLSGSEVMERLSQSGYNEVVETKANPLLRFAGKFWGISAWMLELVVILSWYLKKYPQIPFAYPQLKITPDSVTGEGDVLVTGLRLHVSGKARITLQDGLPVVEIISLNLPLPPAMRQAIEHEIQIQLLRADLLPVRFSSAEWKSGEVLVKGIIK